ncbi:MAG TPA: UDP-4-amino-4,6-dideoxy-N-acetyl-beta-L-altrosamine transaminase [Planctomycetota bacterium]|nr:UDP-4-amino-4,6-dideoxy-N-acetyl-beta-L-altrosamine transaminase [Planctomycetota bacterium]
MPDELPSLSYGRQWIDDDDIRAVTECLRGDWLTQGPAVERFEKALCDATGARFAVAVCNGTAALHLAVLALGVKPGDLGLVPAITFVASANAIAYAGGKVRFVDVRPESALIDLESLERTAETEAKAGRPPRLFIPVDMAGQTADLPAVRRIADRYGARVLEDAAHSLGAAYRHDGARIRAGSCVHSDAAILSFHPVKTITTGEGGAVLTNSETVAGQLRELRSHGIHRDPARFQRTDQGPWYHEQENLGFNYRITDLQCALGSSQLGKLEKFLARRRDIAALYDAALARAPLQGRLSPLSPQPGRDHAYHLYVIRVLAAPGQVASARLALYHHLRARRIFTQVHYIPVCGQPYYRRHHGARPEEYPGATAYYESCLSLPMHPSLSQGDVDRVVQALSEWVQSS